MITYFLKSTAFCAERAQSSWLKASVILSLEVGRVLLHVCDWNLLKASRVYCKFYWHSQLCLIGSREGVADSKWILLMHCYDAVPTKQHGESISKHRRMQYKNSDNTRHENAVLSYYNCNPPSRSRDNSGVTATRLRVRWARVQFLADIFPLQSVQTISRAHTALYLTDTKVYIPGGKAAGTWNWHSVEVKNGGNISAILSWYSA